MLLAPLEFQIWTGFSFVLHGIFENVTSSIFLKNYFSLAPIFHETCGKHATAIDNLVAARGTSDGFIGNIIRGKGRLVTGDMELNL